MGSANSSFELLAVKRTLENGFGGGAGGYRCVMHSAVVYCANREFWPPPQGLGRLTRDNGPLEPGKPGSRSDWGQTRLSDLQVYE